MKTPIEIVSALMDIPNIRWNTILSFMPDYKLASPFRIAKAGFADDLREDETLMEVAYWNGF